MKWIRGFGASICQSLQRPNPEGLKTRGYKANSIKGRSAKFYLAFDVLVRCGRHINSSGRLGQTIIQPNHIIQVAAQHCLSQPSALVTDFPTSLGMAVTSQTLLSPEYWDFSGLFGVLG